MFTLSTSCDKIQLHRKKGLVCMCEQSYHHKDLKNTLIKEGIRYINVYGERSLSMRKLAALCHVSHTALYKHFQNKEEFYERYFCIYRRQFTEALQRS